MNSVGARGLCGDFTTTLAGVASALILVSAVNDELPVSTDDGTGEDS